MKLYVIATGDYGKREFLERVEAVLRGGAQWLQLRVKEMKRFEELAESVARLCRRYGAVYIINDFVDIAASLADGAHVGKDDLQPEEARRRLGGKILGVSCYNQLSRALRAERAGADYVAFGSLFPSPTKPDAVRVSEDVIVRAKRLLKTKICLIGGINLNNLPAVVRLNPDLVAVSSAIFASPDPEKEAELFRRRMDELTAQQRRD